MSTSPEFRLAQTRSRAIWRELVVLASLTLLAVVAGIAAKEADESQIQWAADLGTYAAAWVIALALIGRLAPGLTQAAIRSIVFFATMCFAYYAWARYVMGFPFYSHFVLWMALAFTAVPVIAAAVRWASIRQSAFAGLILAAIAALAVVDGLAWQLWWAWMLDEAPEGFPLRPVQAFLGIAVALTIAGIFPRHNRTRLVALALLLPVAIILDIVVNRFFGAVFTLI